MNCKFSIIQLLAEKSPSFGKKSFSCALPALVDKFADIKVKVQSGDTLLMIAEKMTLNYTSLQVLCACTVHVHVNFMMHNHNVFLNFMYISMYSHVYRIGYDLMFLFWQVLKYAFDQKSPKVHSESLELLCRGLKEFGFLYVNEIFFSTYMCMYTVYVQYM